MSRASPRSSLGPRSFITLLKQMTYAHKFGDRRIPYPERTRRRRQGTQAFGGHRKHLFFENSLFVYLLFVHSSTQQSDIALGGVVISNFS